MGTLLLIGGVVAAPTAAAGWELCAPGPLGDAPACVGTVPGCMPGHCRLDCVYGAIGPVGFIQCVGWPV